MVNIGDLALTPYPPRGVVLVVEIQVFQQPYEEMAVVIMLHDHKGYPAWSRGGYPRDELTRLDAATTAFHDLITTNRPNP